MYKNTILFVLLLCLGKAIVAQNHEDMWVWPDENTTDELTFHLDTGPMIGVGLASVSNSSDYDIGFQNGLAYQLGFSVNARLAHRMNPTPHSISRFGLGVEVMMSGGTVETRTVPVNALNLAIPVLMQFYPSSNFLLEAGTTFVKYFNVSPEFLQVYNVIFHVGDLKPKDVMLTIGASYKMPIGLTLDIRGNFGTSSMAKNLNVRTNSYMISIKYLFPLLK